MILGNLIKSFAQLLHLIIGLYIIVIIVRSIISWMGNIPTNSFILILRRLTDPLFRFMHKRFPYTIVGGVDISPIIIIVILYFIDNFIYNVLINYSNTLVLGG